MAVHYLLSSILFLSFFSVSFAQKISELPAATSIETTDLFVIVQDDTTRKVTSDILSSFDSSWVSLKVTDTLNVGFTTPNETVPYLRMIGDADSDAADVIETLEITLTPNANPVLSEWMFESTQARRYTFDNHFRVGIAGESEALPTFSITADADSDVPDVTETLTITLTPNADPTLATWDFTTTQSAGYTFDVPIPLGSGGTAETTRSMDIVAAGSGMSGGQNDVLFGANTDVTITHTAAVDIVTTSPLTVNAGANLDNVITGSNADITLAITMLKDIVTTAPLTGGEDDVLPGANADLTLDITMLSDIEATSPITINGGANQNNVLVGNDVDFTFGITVAKDLVTTAPLTGGTDNILTGADGDITLAITVAKDLVTTHPLTGGTDNILTGADGDITLAIQADRDLVTTAPLTGGTDDVFLGVDGDITLAITTLGDIVATAPITINGGAVVNNVLVGNDVDFTFGINEGDIDHDGLTNFVANEHNTIFASSGVPPGAVGATYDRWEDTDNGDWYVKTATGGWTKLN